MVDLDQFRQTFFEECDDCLAALEQRLMAFQAGHVTGEGIEDAFRAVHSIKGGAGAFGFSRIIAFSHELETVLDRLRNDEVGLDDDLNAAMLRAFDILTDLIADERTGAASDDGPEAASLAELQHFARPDGGTAAPAEITDGPVTDIDAEGSGRPEARVRRFNIAFRPGTAMLQRGNEPLLLFRELQRLGALHVQVDFSALPGIGKIETLTSYFGWSLDLEADCSPDDVAEIFEFVEGDCDLDISETGGADKRTGAVTADITGPDDGQDSPADQPAKALEGAGGFSSIRVELERIDRMVDMVGETVIAQAAILQQVDEDMQISHPQLVESLQQFMRHTQNLQDSVMAIRAQPVKSIFDRMPRLVRELSQRTGKSVLLELSGEDTEIDKTVVENLSDPLTHMIRNAVDHGIEQPHVRRAAGKPESGTLRLSARQRGSHIVIELSDDGKGLDRQAIRNKGIERGLISADAQLSDQETDDLIFKPGFSTASVVSDLSGRGVGMDVVNENIRKLGGRVGIRSQAGAGSTVTLILPLTLAVMDGMVARIGPTCFIIPLTSIVESMALHDCRIAMLPGQGEVLQFRNEYLKIYDLRKLFGFDQGDDIQTPLLMVIETDGREALGLRVDEIIGQQQVVVKNLENDLIASNCVAGGSILGNGEVALILDANGLGELDAARWENGSEAGGEPGRHTRSAAA